MWVESTASELLPCLPVPGNSPTGMSRLSGFSASHQTGNKTNRESNKAKKTPRKLSLNLNGVKSASVTCNELVKNTNSRKIQTPLPRVSFSLMHSKKICVFNKLPDSSSGSQTGVDYWGFSTTFWEIRFSGTDFVKRGLWGSDGLQPEYQHVLAVWFCVSFQRVWAKSPHLWAGYNNTYFTRLLRLNEIMCMKCLIYDNQ